MQPLQDATGQKHHRLLIERMLGFDEKHHTLCLCRCDCGGQTIEKLAEVISGHVKSCGCLQKCRKPDLVGQRFGRLLVIRLAGKDSRNNRVFECLCDCGKTKLVPATQLTGGYVQSCGCLLQEKRNENILKAQAVQVKHGLSGTQLYGSWSATVARCFDVDSNTYPRYGGCGITMCDGLRSTPTALLESIGHPTMKEHTVDRYPNQKGNYTCGTCEHCLRMKWPKNIRWATRQEQCENRKSTVWVIIDGVLKTRMQAAQELGIPYKKAVYLLKKFEVNTKRIEFRPPAGVVPEGTKAGEEFDAVCTFRVKSDGQICLVQVADEKMPGYSDKDRDKGKPSYKDEHEAMMGSGGGQVQTGYTAQ